MSSAATTARASSARDPELFEKEGMAAPPAPAGPRCSDGNQAAPARSRRSPPRRSTTRSSRTRPTEARVAARARRAALDAEAELSSTARSSTRPLRRRCGRFATSCGRGRTPVLWLGSGGAAGRGGGGALPLPRVPRRRAAGGPEPPRAGSQRSCGGGGVDARPRAAGGRVLRRATSRI